MVNNCKTTTDKPKVIMLDVDADTWNKLNVIARSKVSRLKPYTQDLLRKFVNGELDFIKDLEKLQR